ncbi:hypothetical protein SAMN05421827_10953 [Pedobacter terrae]|uniref:Uncharacterized protein n=1 Tax=Pedobacter terrae TaxID=405671 RepID=A0A1G7W190_9SPHI|nr:hypothetical protein SAMN05421827_10953 [Pedobacter terrae]
MNLELTLKRLSFTTQPKKNAFDKPEAFFLSNAFRICWEIQSKQTNCLCSLINYELEENVTIFNRSLS